MTGIYRAHGRSSTAQWDTTDLARRLQSAPAREGWDFARVRDCRAPVPWDYAEVVQRYLTPSASVLDIGTGGGERFLAMAHLMARGLGTDIDPKMIGVARRRARAARIANVTFAVISARALAVGQDAFDVVLNRHCVVDPTQTMRVLRSGGLFITQQVGEHNTREICEAFGCDPGGQYPPQGSSAPEPIHTVADLSREFERLGGIVRAQGEYDVPYAFLDLGSFLFWLKALPMPEDLDGDVHADQITALIRRAVRGDRLETNEHRELLVIQKP